MTVLAFSARLGLATVAAVAVALPAFAQTQTARTTQAPRAEAQVWRTASVEASADAPRVVLVCEQGAIARRNFERRFGQEPMFITADQALAARDRNEVWAAPRCMTQRQLDRLVDRLN
ncbi:hypothetical protein ACO2Q1_05160 [Brevundimonas sp. VNH65]|uniref:hypothetical protein n=1 Tax=Brevundimonas sp. VNH65 TaxID=3400917 RepID=UPI003C0566FD